MDLYITNPEQSLVPEEKRIPLGATITTQQDGDGSFKHLVEAVKPDTPAFTMQLRPEDELVIVNDQLIVNKKAAQLCDILDEVFIDQPFTLTIRRATRPTCGWIRSTQVQEEYWQIETTIKLERDHCGNRIPIATNVSRSRLKNGDIRVRNPADVQTRYINTSNGFLKCDNGQIGMSELRDNDPGFKFHLITYDGIVMKDGKLVQSRIRLLRHTSESNNYFLYASLPSGNIKFKAAPAIIGEVPSKRRINRARQVGTFWIKSALFLSHPAGGGEIFHIECGNKLEFYLKAKSTRPYISIIGSETLPPSHIDGVRFELLSP